MHTFYMAPLRGITDRIFRAVFEDHFGRFDYNLAPFIPTIRARRVRDHHVADVLPDEYNDPRRLIPQIIGNDADDFLLLCRKFAELGFASVNWNLGCPAPNITKKKRGSGLLPHYEFIERFLDRVIPRMPLPLSIKTRLGLDNADDLEKLIPVFNRCPLNELIIHPRTGVQMYDGETDLNKFEICLRISKHPVVYNGDIRTADDFKGLAARFPGVTRWMIGRGIIMNPYLLSELKVETPGSTVRRFLTDLLDKCDNRRAPEKVLGRMKEIWRYLGARYGNTLAEKVLYCETIDEYRSVMDKYL